MIDFVTSRYNGGRICQSYFSFNTGKGNLGDERVYNLVSYKSSAECLEPIKNDNGISGQGSTWMPMNLTPNYLGRICKSSVV